ncbi:MAG: hypothetical protein CEE40_09100 [Chloroflexi bacterium B3_Chlor]|nr:MAG: hypothetical protein CEE40_09100 [Chloroflexi bacterium B3_Chlor]
MDLVRTTGRIDELLVRAAEKSLSERLLEDYQNAGTHADEVDPVMPIRLCGLALEGLLCGDYMVDSGGNPLEEPVTDRSDEEYWKDRLNQARKWWVDYKEDVVYLDSLTLSQLQEAAELPSKNAARRWAQRISEKLLFRTVVVEAIDASIELLKSGWETEKSCLALRSDAVDWVVGRCVLSEEVATEAKKGQICLGLRPSEHYSLAYGLYSPTDNTTRVRCELRHPDPLAAIIIRRTTIVHEAVHAVSIVQTGYDNLDPAGDWTFFEGLAELCTLHYLKQKFEESEDWLYLPHSAYYELTTPPRYVEALRRIESIYDLTRDYRILSALLKVDPGSVSVADIIQRIERVVNVLGRELAAELSHRVLDSVQTDLVAPVLYVVGDRSRDDLLGLLTDSAEAWEDLAAAAASAWSAPA